MYAVVCYYLPYLSIVMKAESVQKISNKLYLCKLCSNTQLFNY